MDWFWNNFCIVYQLIPFNLSEELILFSVKANYLIYDSQLKHWERKTDEMKKNDSFWEKHWIGKNKITMTYRFFKLKKSWKWDALFNSSMLHYNPFISIKQNIFRNGRKFSRKRVLFSFFWVKCFEFCQMVDVLD